MLKTQLVNLVMQRKLLFNNGLIPLIRNDFYRKSRYDYVQVSHQNGTKFYCKLLSVFVFKDVVQVEHQLAFVQHSKIREECSHMYKRPLLELKDSYNLIAINAVDRMVEFKPRRGTDDQFYLHTDVEYY